MNFYTLLLLRKLDQNEELRNLYPRIDDVQLVVSTYSQNRLILSYVDTYEEYLVELFSILLETYSTSAQTAYHKWFTECLFRVLPGEDQCSTLFVTLTEQVTRGSSWSDPDPRIQLRHGLIQFLRYTDLFVLINRENFNREVSHIVLDCNLLNPNFLGSIRCNTLYTLWSPRLHNYQSYMAFVFGVCVKINILSYDGYTFSLSTRRASRSIAEMNERLQKVVQHIAFGTWLEYNEEVRTLFQDRDVTDDIINAYDGHQFRENNLRLHGIGDRVQDESYDDIELVDYDLYTAPVQRGVSSITLYESFFEQACSAPSDRLQALRRIVSSYANAMSLSIPSYILETKDGICQWLHEEQLSRTRECVNQIEPFTQENVSEIPLLFLWKHRTRDKHVQCYDLLSLRDYIMSNPTNPLTRDMFEADEIEKIDHQFQFVIALMRVIFDNDRSDT